VRATEIKILEPVSEREQGNPLSQDPGHVGESDAGVSSTTAACR